MYGGADDVELQPVSHLTAAAAAADADHHGQHPDGTIDIYAFHRTYIENDDL